MPKETLGHATESKKAFKKMNDPLQAVALELTKQERRENQGVIKIAREQGQLVGAVMNKPDKYGQNSVELLATYLNRTPDWLYKLHRFSTAFCDETMEELFQLGRLENKSLTLSHLILLSALTGKNESFIKALAKKAIKGRWTVADLKVAISESKPSKSSKAGTQMSIPAGLQQMLKTVEATNTKVNGWIECVFDEISNTPPGNITETIENDLGVIREQLENLNENSLFLAKRVGESLDRCARIKAEREKQSRSDAEELATA